MDDYYNCDNNKNGNDGNDKDNDDNIPIIIMRIIQYY